MSFSVAASPPTAVGPAQWSSVTVQGSYSQPWASHSGFNKPGSSLPSRLTRGPSPAKSSCGSSLSTEDSGSSAKLSDQPQKRVEGFQ
eukprot:scaffold316116_cov43-Prasinocladus_malaysianus.AAC.1